MGAARLGLPKSIYYYILFINLYLVVSALFHSARCVLGCGLG